MTDNEDATPQRRPSVDGPTVMGPSTGHLHGPPPAEPTLPATPDKPATPPAEDEPTLRDPGTTPPVPPRDEPPLPAPPTTTPHNPPVPPPAAQDGEPTLPEPGAAPRDEPTLPEPIATSATATQDDEPTLPEPDAAPPVPHTADPVDERTAPAFPDGPTVATPRPPAFPDGPTVATPVAEATPPPPATWPYDPAVATPAPPTTWPYGPTMDTPVATPADDEPTTAVADDTPTTTGPTVASWPLDELLPPPPTDLVWRPDTPPPPPRRRSPAYHIALGAAVVLVVALVAAAAAATVVRPTREVAGTAKATQAIPEITAPSTEAPPTTTTQQQVESPAEHPLSTSTARMGDATCALPRFDLPDASQAAFFAAAKTCADNAWRPVLAEAGLEGNVEVVTVTGPVQTDSCGEITADSPSTQCDGTVYMTPAHLRDVEKNGRYPGRYFGVFLREYARALQYATGLAELAANVDGADDRLARQATCLAGVASGAMANRGAVDANITGEISDRLSSVDAPADAKAWLDKGFQARTLDACNTWT